MEVEATTGEIRYSLKIPNLSSYTEENELYTEFSLSLGGLRSRWGVRVQPFLFSRPHKPHYLNSDIGITLSCVRSSIKRPDIDIYCSVVGRGEEHEKKLELLEKGDCEIPPTWQGVLVPRLALQVFHLLPHDQLTATLRFVVRTDDLWRNVDPLEELSAQLGNLRKGKHSDIDILTSDGVTIPAHRAILHARSSLWDQSQGAGRSLRDTSEDIAKAKTSDYLGSVKNRSETSFDSIFESDMSASDPTNSSLSPTYTGSLASICSPSLSTDRVPSAGSVASITSPRHPRTVSHRAGDKRLYTLSKHTTSRLTQNSPSPKILSWEKQIPRPREASPLVLVSSDSGNSSTPGSVFSKSPLKEPEINCKKSPPKGYTIKVNMSASVTRSMLDWIYTGQCSDLERLARPLLVGGKRHGVSGLVQACEQHLAAALTAATAPHTLLLAHKYSANALCLATMKYAVTQAKEVTSQPSWASVASCAPDLMTEFSRLLALHAHPSRRR